MREWGKEQRTAEWNRDLYERVGKPLCPEELRSVLLIVPGNSGDVALATTVVRHIKDQNPQCRVSFASKRANLSLLKMCPGVDDIIETPPLPPTTTPSRQRHLAEYAGAAESVIYPICVSEDIDLLRRYDFLETIWLLSGIPNGMPEGPQNMWLTPPDAPEIAAGVLRRSLSRDFSSHLTSEARRQPGMVIGQALRQRNARNLGWKNAVQLLRNASYIRGLSSRIGLPHDPRRFVIISNEANSVQAPPRGLFGRIVHFLRSQGRIVLQNVLDPARAAPGTVPLVCSYEEFLSLRAAGVPFVGWRSGLCDIAAASQTPMCVLYPTSMMGCSIGLRSNCETLHKSFGFTSMNIAADCLELVCDSAADLDLEKLATILD